LPGSSQCLSQYLDGSQKIDAEARRSRSKVADIVRDQRIRTAVNRCIGNVSLGVPSH